MQPLGLTPSDPGLRMYIDELQALQPAFPVFTDSMPPSGHEAHRMNPKKIYEVGRLAAFITKHAGAVKNLVDIGAGQGYLSHYLTTAADFNVLAVEGREHNTQQADRRGQRIARKKKQAGSFQSVSLHLTPENFGEVITFDQCCLIGLHTCGNLAVMCYRFFLEQPSVRKLFNVGCCYHLIKEFLRPEVRESAEFARYLETVGHNKAGRPLEDTFTDDQADTGFPLSNYILTNYPQFYLGRIARLLAMEGPTKSHLENPHKIFQKFNYRSAL
jgi:hypothetical protein